MPLFQAIERYDPENKGREAHAFKNVERQRWSQRKMNKLILDIKAINKPTNKIIG